MKRFSYLLYMIICIIVLIGLVGCGIDSIRYSNTEAQPSQRSIKNSNTSTPSPVLSDVDKFMKDYNITLTAKDVQFDLKNNLDKYFAIDGYATLDSYYNYGFVNFEEKWFCIRVTPVDGDSSDSWYIYGGRDDAFKDIFDKLKAEGEIHIIAGCFIPKKFYEDGQGNLAVMDKISY